jgi:putative ABC transport system permease protein
MTTFWQDVLYGIRVFVKRPGFTAIASLSLALGIGASTAIFSLVNTISLGSLSFREPGRLVIIGTIPPEHPEQTGGATVADFMAWTNQSRSFETIGAASGDERDLGPEENGAPAERVAGEEFSPSMFEVLGVRPILGRTFTDQEDQVDGRSPVMLISHPLWRRRYASDPNAIDRTIRSGRETFMIIGVMPPDFRFSGGDANYWVPLNINGFQLQSSAPYLLVAGRLRPGISMPQPQSEMEGIARQLARDFPARNKGRGVRVQPIRDGLFGWLQRPLSTLQGVVAFVLLIACANVAGLLLARAPSRQTEVALRSALGAGRSRIVRQFLTESILLSLFGGILGALLAWVGARALIAGMPPYFPRLHEIGVDARVLAFSAVLSSVTSLAFGAVPALRISKSSLAESLKESARGSVTGAAGHRILGTLAAGQVALALVLLVGAGLMIRSFLRLHAADLGCDPSGLVSFGYSLPVTEYTKPIGAHYKFPLFALSPVPAFTFDRLYEGILAVPGVKSAAGSVYLPLTGAENMTFTIEGRPVPVNDAERNAFQANFFAVALKFFSTMKAPLLRGRDFTAHDTASPPWVAIINQTMARAFWPNEDLVGKHVTLDLTPEERPHEVIGVVRDVKADRYQTKPQPGMYVPHVQMPLQYRGLYQWTRVNMSFVVRISGNRSAVTADLRRVVADTDRNRPVGEFRTMDPILGEQAQEPRYYALLLAIFAGLATSLALVGIYGVTAYSVGQRTREIGIRMALRAGRSEVLSLVLRHSLVLVGVGLAVGVGGSLVLTRLIASQLWGITATDPATFAGISLALILVALMATFIPTQRAVQVGPTVALRHD